MKPRDIKGPIFGRRAILPIAIGATAGVATLKLSRVGEAPKPPEPPGESTVFIAKAPAYTAGLARIIEDGVKTCGLDVRGKRILLKPNLVEFDKATAINTDVAVLAAALEVFTRLGAAQITIGEGPGHRRDTFFLAQDAAYHKLPLFSQRFVDLNRDDVSPVKGFADLPEIYFPDTVLAADLIVSIPKMKTHHWAGATLSMKNFFGLVPGSVYGWAKNELHRQGIARSISELNRIFRRTFAIVDGVVGMEGNGPIQGAPKNSGVLVMGSDLAAVDATCCRIMGIDPDKVDYLTLARPRGHVEEPHIRQRGESVASVRNPFQLIASFRHMRLA
jgi:uncharacterized protein (DUF362 family)